MMSSALPGRQWGVAFLAWWVLQGLAYPNYCSGNDMCGTREIDPAPSLLQRSPVSAVLVTSGEEGPGESGVIIEQCTSENQGRCDCGGGDGFTTYTLWMKPEGSEEKQQRCFTLYQPMDFESSRPVLIHMQSEAKDQIDPMGTPDLLAASLRYRFSLLLLSTPKGAWTFGNNGIINDEHPLPCRKKDSEDLIYVQAVVDWLKVSSQAKKLDTAHVFTEGLALDAQFALYAGFCFQSIIAGSWQGSPGLAIKGQQPWFPQMQAQCSTSSFQEHGNDCSAVAPCDDCKYWPIKPVKTAKPYLDCISTFTDDLFLQSAEVLYDTMVEHGHSVTFFEFSSDQDIGQRSVANQLSWVVSCLGMLPACQVTCEVKFMQCMAPRRQTFHGCIDQAFESDACQNAPCAPTVRMLHSSDQPFHSIGDAAQLAPPVQKAVGGQADTSIAWPEYTLSSFGRAQVSTVQHEHVVAIQDAVGGQPTIAQGQGDDAAIGSHRYTPEVCTDSCSEAFVNGCVLYRGGGVVGYRHCRDELDAGAGALMKMGCTAGCNDTLQMQALRPSEPGNAVASDSHRNTFEVCSHECSQSFVEACVPYHEGGCTGYRRCRDELDSGTGPVMSTGCAIGCKDTAEMQAVCPSEPGDDVASDSHGITFQVCTDACSEAFVDGCVIFHGGGVEGYRVCRDELDSGIGHLMENGCTAGCNDTVKMQALRATGPGDNAVNSITEITPAVCTDDCSEAFVYGCAPYHGVGVDGYRECRGELDSSSGPLMKAGCIPGCNDTLEMQALRTSGPSDDAANNTRIPPEVCTDACSEAFVDGCVIFHGGGVDGYRECRDELDSGIGHLMENGCTVGCKDSLEMQALRAVSSSKPGNEKSKLEPKICTTVCSEAFVDECVPFYEGGCAGYRRCRDELDAGNGPLMKSVCAVGCKDTSEMHAVCASGPTVRNDGSKIIEGRIGGDEGGNSAQPQIPEPQFEACTDECSEDFVKCASFFNGGCGGYRECRHYLDTGTQWVLQSCTPGCKDTAIMRAECADEGSVGGGDDGREPDAKPIVPKRHADGRNAAVDEVCTAECSQEFVDACVPFFDGGCHGYRECRYHLDEGTLWILQECAGGCKDTVAMRAVCADLGGMGGDDEEPEVPKAKSPQPEVEVCSTDCSRVFIDECVPRYGGNCAGYTFCRHALEMGIGPLTTTICAVGCKDTSEMHALCASEPDVDDSNRRLPKPKDDVCTPGCAKDFVSWCVPFYEGGCEGYRRCRNELNSGIGPIMAGSCVVGCRDTASMRAMCADESADDGGIDSTEPEVGMEVPEPEVELCTPMCSRMFVNVCALFYSGGCEGYGRCREELDAGIASFLGGCIAGCRDTPDMQALCRDDRESEVATKAWTKPSVPSECTPANQGRCDCDFGSGSEYKTYTWWMTPNDALAKSEQRCFTLYRPSDFTAAAPVLMHMQCFGKDRLAGVSNRRLEEAAKRYHFAVLLLSTPHGEWTFGNDGVVNDANPMPCDAEDSADIVYMRGVLDWLHANSKDLRLDESRVFTEGFGQNAMFAAYAGMCFHERVAGTFQGGSGLVLTGESALYPGMRAQCSASSFKEHKQDCVVKDPCTECRYWPIYPAKVSETYVTCISSYKDDFLHETSRNMFDAMVKTGHDSRLLAFTPGGTRGHTNPANEYSWVVGCLGMLPSCSPTCEARLQDCFESAESTNTGVLFHPCLDEAFASPECAFTPCAPTLSMLKASDSPQIELSTGAFGRT